MASRLPGNTGIMGGEDLKSDLYLYQILEETPNGVMVVNTSHRITYANPAASLFLDVPFAQLGGSHLGTVLGEDNKDLFALFVDFFAHKTGKQSSRFRKEITIAKEGKEKRMLDVVFVYPPSRPDYYILYLIEITHLKILERELRRRNVFFHNLIDSSVDGIIAADMTGNIILFNQGAQSLLGYSEEETLAGAGFHVTQLYNEGVAYEVIKRMRSNEFGGKGKLRHQELVVKHKSGQDIPVSFSGGIIYDNDQEIATYGIFTDLRAMQKIEEDLENTHQMLMQSEKMAGLGRLAAGVAHEINNPMSGIMLYANMVLEDLGENHVLEDDLKTIIREAERCKVIVADLLEFSHQTSYEMDQLNLNDVITKTLGVLKNQPSFHNIEIVLNLDRELRPVFGNAIRLNQVIMNILVNAAQAMPTGGKLTITSRNRANSDIAEILISDSGHGIEPELREKIFDPFFTTKKPGEGTGLGLSVSYAIVKEHQGTIRVAESSSEGTTFALRFPAVQETPTGENHAEHDYFTG
ncbi:ATP-binding protein [Desulfopila aestuarii]|uniref:histidine kinase n=1 Tax=Desulfopila aestuarii DSM 18488 TaxID=1121416 RepID=A0A1M7Y3F4_9BACT|nr:ATP-binding protein [Desulfopila aestuarii]SHO46644.1 PAS domain S-box-containing protein [Desulfopila aestuarii DSM 18488]